MNTSATDDPNATCDVERVDDLSATNPGTYLCCKPARFVWFPAPDVRVNLCSACKRWLETMESLGLKIT